MITGLYAENHLLVSNHFYDPLRKEEYKISNPKAVGDGSWYGGFPLWVVAEQQHMLSASFFWPGSEAAIQQTRPTYYYDYQESIPHTKRTEQIVDWLKLPEEKRPHFMTLYFSDVDTQGHQFGPQSEEVKQAVLDVDHTLGKLFKNLESFTHIPLHIIIVSDHGMSDVDPQKVIYVEDLLTQEEKNHYQWFGSGPQMMGYLNEHHQPTSQKTKLSEDLIYKKLSHYQKKNPHFQVFKRQEAPHRYHISQTPRAGDVILNVHPPYSLQLTKDKARIRKGDHGYDPLSFSSMHGIFYAQGPSLKKEFLGKTIPAFENIHLYPFILKILQLSPITPVDGKSSVLSPYLF
jgi:alkaline phosphatase D